MTEAYDEGMRLRESGDLRAAASAFQRAVEDEPGLAAAWFWLGTTRDNLGNEADTIPAYERALELGLRGPEEVKAWAWLASSYSIVGRHEDAAVLIKRAESRCGYEPLDEFVRIARNVRQRSTQ